MRRVARIDTSRPNQDTSPITTVIQLCVHELFCVHCHGRDNRVLFPA